MIELLVRDRVQSPDWVRTRGLFVVLLGFGVWMGLPLLTVGPAAWWTTTTWFPRWVDKQHARFDA